MVALSGNVPLLSATFFHYRVGLHFLVKGDVNRNRHRVKIFLETQWSSRNSGARVYNLSDGAGRDGGQHKSCGARAPVKHELMMFLWEKRRLRNVTVKVLENLGARREERCAIPSPSRARAGKQVSTMKKTEKKKHEYN